jgi:hypothetical protein
MSLLNRPRYALSTLLAILATASPTQVARADTCTTATTIHYAGNFGPPQPLTTDPPLFFIVDHLTGTSPLLGHFTATYPHVANLATGQFAGVAAFTGEDGSTLYILLSGTASMTSPTSADISLTGRVLDGTASLDGASGRLTGTGTVDLATGAVGSTTLAGAIRTDC